ncbi:hypothetical protein ABZ412_30610 [Nocardia sp. NPDC005746]|uniref:hypothetical protein n=1 Tax=Nocardia sp. NPDC005746 TaxID=3157062 RepID=UPI0033CEAE0A
MQRYRAALDTLGGGIAAAVAGMALIVPYDAGCGTDSSVMQMTVLTITVPRATATGAVFAVVAAVLVRMLGDRTAWATGVCAALVLATDHLLVASSSATLATANFLDSLAGGVLLGAAGAAALRYRPPAVGYLLGGLTGVLLGRHIETIAAENGNLSVLERAFVDLPPDWLAVLAAVLLAVCAVVCGRTSTTHPTSVQLPFAPIVAAAVVITTIAVASERLTPGTHSWIAITAWLVAVVAAALIAALLLPGRDGTLTLLAVSLTATGGALATVHAHWKLAPVLAILALGLFAGVLLPRPQPVAAAAASIGLSVFALLASGAQHHDSWAALLGACLYAGLAGYSFGAVTTRLAASTVLALGVVLVPTAALTLQYRGCDALPSLPDGVSTAGDRAAWTAIGLGAGCLAAMLVLRRLRPERDEPSQPKPLAPESERTD